MLAKPCRSVLIESSRWISRQLLRPHPSPEEKLIFWVGHVIEVIDKRPEGSLVCGRSSRGRVMQRGHSHSRTDRSLSAGACSSASTCSSRTRPK